MAGIKLDSLKKEAEKRQAARDTDVVIQMTQKLSDDIRMLDKRSGQRHETFPSYKEARAIYMEIMGLVDTIQGRYPAVLDRLPKNFEQWLLRAKLKGIAVFTKISHDFISDPPITLTQSFGAWDVLNSERIAFAKVVDQFDTMLLEAGIDDKTADVLDATRTQIEAILAMIDRLLETSPPPLTEFE